MIIPIGHDQQTVRRLPWVTFAIIAVNVVAFLATMNDAGEAEKRNQEAGNAAFEYWMAHPYLDFKLPIPKDKLPPSLAAHLQEFTEVLKSTHKPPEDADQIANEQTELDGLVQAWNEARESHPFLKWGLVPAHVTLQGLLTSMFMHAGWLHLIANMLFLYLAAPAVEDAYGRPVFTALYVVGGIVAALVFVAANPGSQGPLVGASGAIAAVMGAFLIRCSAARIRFFYFLFLRGGVFSAPAWVMLPLWLLEQLFFASMPTSNGVAYVAHVGGFMFGALAAFTIKALKVEDRFVKPAIDKQVGVEQHHALEEGMDFLARGDTPAAREALSRVLLDDPRNTDALLATWQSFVHDGDPAQGAEYLVKVIDAELRARDTALAFDHWRELVSATGAGGPPSLRWRMATELQGHDAAGADEVLHNLADDPSADQLRDKARLRLGLPTTETAASPSTARPANPPKSPPAEPTTLSPHVAPPPQPVYEPDEPHDAAARAMEVVSPSDPPADPEEWLPAGPSADAATAARDGLKVEPCTIERVDADGLLLRGSGGAAELLPFGQIAAIALAGIAGAGRPYLVIDLIVADPSGDGHTAFRAVSSQMDPRKLIGRPDLAPLDAFRELVRAVAAASYAAVLPAPEALQRIPMFATPEEFEERVLAAYA